jgi:hypothetical protein
MRRRGCLRLGGELALDPDPRQYDVAEGGHDYHCGRSFPGLQQVRSAAADVDQAAGLGEPAPVMRARGLLVGDAR